MSQFKNILTYSAFHSIQEFSDLHKAHPYWGGQYALLNLPIQIINSSRNTLSKTHRKNVQPNT